MRTDLERLVNDVLTCAAIAIRDSTPFLVVCALFMAGIGLYIGFRARKNADLNRHH